MRSDVLNLKEFVRPIGILGNGGLVKFSGTGFGIGETGLVLTAAHVVAATDKPQAIFLQLSNGSFLQPQSVSFHPTADVAALRFNPDRSLRAFELGEPPPETGEFYLGTDVCSYGYPFRQDGPNRKTLEPRLMCGHIQRFFQHEQNPYCFRACELSFPAIQGQSGSPIVLAHQVKSAIAVLTSNFESSTVVDSYEEHVAEQGERVVYTKEKVISYGIGAALWPLADWIKAL